MTEAEIRRIVADTVEQTLTRIGVDTQNPIEFQKDLQHLRSWRESVATVKKQSLVTAIGIITTGIVALVWVAVRGH